MDIEVRQIDGVWDWAIDPVTGDIKTDSGLYETVACALFTNRIAEDTEVIWSQNRYGWWGSVMSPVGHLIGSKLYQFQRIKIVPETVEGLRRAFVDSLQFLVDDGIAEDVTVDLERVDITRMEVKVNIYKPQSVEVFDFDFLWSDFAI